MIFQISLSNFFIPKEFCSWWASQLHSVDED
jgi:hypothetical protein